MSYTPFTLFNLCVSFKGHAMSKEQYLHFRQIIIYQPQIPNIFPKSQIIVNTKSQNFNLSNPKYHNTPSPHPLYITQCCNNVVYISKLWCFLYFTAVNFKKLS